MYCCCLDFFDTYISLQMNCNSTSDSLTRSNFKSNNKKQLKTNIYIEYSGNWQQKTNKQFSDLKIPLAESNRSVNSFVIYVFIYTSSLVHFEVWFYHPFAVVGCRTGIEAPVWWNKLSIQRQQSYGWTTALWSVMKLIIGLYFLIYMNCVHIK